MKMTPATCDCGVEFLREPHDDYPRCSECFFEHDAPALKKLTEEVSTEKRSGTARQDERQTAQKETQQEKGSNMSNDTPDLELKRQQRVGRRNEQDQADEPPQVKAALNEWANGNATFGDLMMASEGAGVDPGPVMQKAMQSALTEEQLAVLLGDGDEA